MTDQNAITVQGGGFISPVADIQTALRRYQAVKDFIGSILKPGVDYGVIPGSDKPTLLKPGAEKMTAFFGFTVRFVLVDKVLDWTGKDHDGEPFFNFDYRAQLWRGGELIAEGDGSCNSWEKKYRYRNSERVCPACGKPTIIKGKAEYGGGFLCYAKKGGCGAKYKDNDPAITEQIVGQVKNPDPADLVNTIQKMAQKRALIAPVLIATNTSEYFTQDIEDYIDGTFVEHIEQPAPTPKPTPPAKATEQPAPAPEQPAELMDYQQACMVLNSENKPYGEIDTAKLTFMYNKMGNLLKNGGPGLADEKATEYQFKRGAIESILAHRSATQAGG